MPNHNAKCTICSKTIDSSRWARHIQGKAHKEKALELGYNPADKKYCEKFDVPIQTSGRKISNVSSTPNNDIKMLLSTVAKLSDELDAAKARITKLENNQRVVKEDEVDQSITTPEEVSEEKDNIYPSWLDAKNVEDKKLWEEIVNYIVVNDINGYDDIWESIARDYTDLFNEVEGSYTLLVNNKPNEVADLTKELIYELKPETLMSDDEKQQRKEEERLQQLKQQQAFELYQRKQADKQAKLEKQQRKKELQDKYDKHGVFDYSLINNAPIGRKGEDYIEFCNNGSDISNTYLEKLSKLTWQEEYTSPYVKHRSTEEIVYQIDDVLYVVRQSDLRRDGNNIRLVYDNTDKHIKNFSEVEDKRTMVDLLRPGFSNDYAYLLGFDGSSPDDKKYCIGEPDKYGKTPKVDLDNVRAVIYICNQKQVFSVLT